MFSNLFSVETWHNDEHLIESIKVFVLENYSTEFDPLELFRLGMNDRVSLYWDDDHTSDSDTEKMIVRTLKKLSDD